MFYFGEFLIRKRNYFKYFNCTLTKIYKFYNFINAANTCTLNCTIYEHTTSQTFIILNIQQHHNVALSQVATMATKVATAAVVVVIKIQP